MIIIKKYLKSYGYLFSILIILTIILSIINYFINIQTNIIKIIIPIISVLISSIILGKNSKEKAYLEGIKFSLGYIIITIFAKILLKTSFNYKIFILYILIILTGIIGSMIGINIKKK